MTSSKPPAFAPPPSSSGTSSANAAAAAASASSYSSTTTKRIYQLVAGQLFDSISRTLVQNQVITIDRDAGVILDVSGQHERDRRSVDEILGLRTGNGKDIRVEMVEIKLESMVLLPGFVDVHVHFFLHPYSETSWEDQVTKESLAERTVRATVHARRTLMAGFTTVRDLGTEGAFDADIALRKCLAGKDAIIPGPRYFCSTRAIISGGSYGPRSSLYPAQEGIDGVKCAEPVDGIEECVKEVRKQIGAGADWIKIYADYPIRARMASVSSAISATAIPTFNKQELSALISTAHTRGVKVAAHANTPYVISELLDLGVDTVEHGGDMYDEVSGDRTLLKKLQSAGGRTTWVPTLAAYYTSALSTGASSFTKKRWERCQRTFQEAIKHDSKNDFKEMDNIACGGDTGVFAHGQNALEMVLMRKLGASWERVLGWATYGGWKAVRGIEWEGAEGVRRINEVESRCLEGLASESGCEGPEAELELERGVPFGALRIGWAADLVGVEGKLDGSPEEFENALMKGVRFVMKGGAVYKVNGNDFVGAF